MDSYIVFALSLIATAIAIVTPILKLNSTIAKLNTTVSILNDALIDMRTKNSRDHQKFFERLAELDERVTTIETKVDIYHHENH